MNIAETMIDGYVTCALWSSTDEDGEALDAVYGPGDIADEATEAMAAECRDFLDLLDREGLDWSAWTPEQLGHDFWLTRNSHGAGFWDRGHGETGDRLTALSKPYGASDLYVGDDGAIYVM